MTEHEVETRVDVQEHGAERDGRRPAIDRRLFMQLQVFTGCLDPAPLAAALRSAAVEAVLYQDACDPRGVGVLSMAEDPALLVGGLRPIFCTGPLSGLVHRPEFSMLGRTYASGYEADLEDWLLKRPRRTVLDPHHRWAVWYPLRRTGAFAQLASREQAGILREHAAIGRAYGEAGLAHDVRLACYGLDARDNEFVIGLLGHDLHPLSHVVQAMRRTRQTAQYIQSMGPFFIGCALWQSPMP